MEAENEKSDADNEIDYLSGFNEDCLIIIFEKLDVRDLINIAEINSRFCAIINAHIISKKQINFTEIKEYFCVRKVFKTFGERIASLQINSRVVEIAFGNRVEVLENMFSLITKYCRKEKLKALDISGNFRSYDGGLCRQFAPMLENLETLTLGGVSPAKTDTVLLNALLSQNTNLKKLKLHRLICSERLDQRLLLQLTELSFSDCFDLPADFNCPNLNAVHFKLSPSVPVSHYHYKMLQIFAENFPNIETFSMEFPRKFRGHFDYNSILGLKKLKRLKIVSFDMNCEDIYVFLKKLAVQNTIEELTIIINSSTSRNSFSGELPSFDSLQLLEIVNIRPGTKEFLVYFIAKLPNLFQCTLSSKNSISQSMTLDVVQLAKRMHVLSLRSSQIALHKLYENIYKVIERKGDSLELCLTRQQKQTILKNSKLSYNPDILKVTSYSD